MSHFGVMVVVDHPVGRAAAEGAVETLLAPYSENLEVPEYEKECWCVGREANHAGIVQANEECNFEVEVERIRSQWGAVSAAYKEATGGEHEAPWSVLDWSFDVIQDPKRREAVQSLYEKQLAEWTGLFEGRDARAKEITKEHPLYGKPEDGCEDCDGTGRERVSYNPQGFWDWYSVGGRWTGVLSGYKPFEDPANKEACRICRGDGKRWWREESSATKPEGLGAVFAREEDGMFVQTLPASEGDPMAEERPCNGCEGTGITTTWPSEWQHEGDVVPLREVLRERTPEEKADPEYSDWTDSFYALVTPDGQWHQKGKMGWFGMSSDNMDAETWRAYERDVMAKVLEQHPMATAVVVDCHV